MNKSNLIKVFSILVISVVVALFFSTTVTATDLTGNLVNDLSGNQSPSPSPSTSSGTNTLTPTNITSPTNTSNSVGNLSTGNFTNTSNSVGNNTSTSNSYNSANTSTYGNNTSLPDTGLGSSMPIAILIVIFGISSVYAYKKINDYKNL